MMILPCDELLISSNPFGVTRARSSHVRIRRRCRERVLFYFGLTAATNASNVPGK